MRKKGFTLIELLAVIVILAIIALIATPIVMNVIEKSKKGSAERSAENYMNTVETAVMEKRIEGEILNEGTYDLETLKEKLGDIELSGQKVTEASIMLKDGKVLDGSILKINDYVVNIIDGAGKVGDFGIAVNDIAGQSTAIKYDPISNSVCQSGDTCYNWYVLEDKGSEYASVSLIMDRNLGNNVAWCNDEILCKENGGWTNSAGPITAFNYLKLQTSNWTVEVSLPTYNQIYNVNNSQSLESTPWLCDYIVGSSNSVPRVFGYWTSTSSFYNNYNSFYVWRVDNESKLNNSYTVTYSDLIGIRPVITILKSNLR